MKWRPTTEHCPRVDFILYLYLVFFFSSLSPFIITLFFFCWAPSLGGTKVHGTSGIVALVLLGGGEREEIIVCTFIVGEERG